MSKGLFAASKEASAAVGGNPNIRELMQSTANAPVEHGVWKTPLVAVGLVLRSSPQGEPLVPAAIPIGGTAYLTVALDVDFKGDDLMLAGDLDKIQVTSWTSNGIRDQNLLSETGLPAEAFSFNTLRRFGFDTAPTSARQQIVIEVKNLDLANVAQIRGLVAGQCGDCNTTRR
jgi:hypothetical protein